MSCVDSSSLGEVRDGAGGMLLVIHRRRRRRHVIAIIAAIVLLPTSLARANVFNLPAGQTSLQFVTVGDPGNAADADGLGAEQHTNGTSFGDVLRWQPILSK